MHPALAKTTFWRPPVAKTPWPQLRAHAADFSFLGGGRASKIHFGRLWRVLGRLLRDLARVVGDFFASWRDLGTSFVAKPL